MMKPFFIRYNRALVKINPENVVFFDTEKNYTRIILTTDVYYMIRSTMLAMLKKLPPDIFIKVHRSYVVSVYHVDYVLRDHLQIRGNIIPVSKRFYGSIVNKLNVIGSEADFKKEKVKSKLARLNSKAKLAPRPKVKTLAEVMKEAMTQELPDKKVQVNKEKKEEGKERKRG
jgi:hypothetical protein